MRFYRSYLGLFAMLIVALAFITWTLNLMVTGGDLQQQAGANVSKLRALTALEKVITSYQGTTAEQQEVGVLLLRVQADQEDADLFALTQDLQKTGDRWIRDMREEDRADLLAQTFEVTQAIRSRNAQISSRLRLLWQQVNILAVIASLMALLTSVLLIFYQRKSRENLRMRKLAEQATAAKSEFLSNMSHELRTPLNAVIGLTDLIIEKPQSSENPTNLKAIKTSANSLLALVNDMLDLSRIEAGKLEFETVEFNSRKMMADLESGFAKATSSKGLTLDVIIDPQVPEWLSGDALRINQVLLNLVSNAIKFTDQGGIRIEVLRTNQQADKLELQFQVSDTGIGIPEEDRLRVFESFQQLKSSTELAVKGAGLGLAISRKLVEGMRGYLWVTSKVNEGSTFAFRLPLKQVDRTDQQEDGALAEPVKDLRQMRVLVAEDNPMNQLVMEQLLRTWNAEFKLVEDGNMVLETLATVRFDLVLMDIQMPDMDGMETTRRIRSQESENGQHIPIVALTANAFQKTEQEVQEVGMDGFIAKPFDHNRLFHLIQSFDRR